MSLKAAAVTIISPLEVEVIVDVSRESSRRGREPGSAVTRVMGQLPWAAADGSIASERPLLMKSTADRRVITVCYASVGQRNFQSVGSEVRSRRGVLPHHVILEARRRHYPPTARTPVVFAFGGGWIARLRFTRHVLTEHSAMALPPIAREALRNGIGNVVTPVVADYVRQVMTVTGWDLGFSELWIFTNNGSFVEAAREDSGIQTETAFGRESWEYPVIVDARSRILRTRRLLKRSRDLASTLSHAPDSRSDRTSVRGHRVAAALLALPAVLTLIAAANAVGKSNARAHRVAPTSPASAGTPTNAQSGRSDVVDARSQLGQLSLAFDGTAIITSLQINDRSIAITGNADDVIELAAQIQRTLRGAQVHIDQLSSSNVEARDHFSLSITTDEPNSAGAGW